MSEEKLSAWQQYKKNLGSTRPWDLLNPSVEHATDDEQTRRMSICNNCPHLLDITKQCKKCGCVMPLKSKLHAATCPIGKWESPKNLIIIPSRDRVANVERVVAAIKDTAIMSHIMIGLDDDNESIYPRLDGVIYEVNPRLRMNGTLNLLSTKYAHQYQTITFMGDDHLPRTKAWDAILYKSIEERGLGFSYGNDLLQGENLPTAVMISTNIIKILGFMAPPQLIHMFMDNFWKDAGNRLGALFYFKDVIIEHMHAYAGKAELDEMYLSVNNKEVADADGIAYGQYVQNSLDYDISKIVDVMGSLSLS